MGPESLVGTEYSVIGVPGWDDDRGIDEKACESSFSLSGFQLGSKGPVEEIVTKTRTRRTKFRFGKSRPNS